jgi:hypothetical protein
MADQGRWFKVWTSILDDPHFQELALEDIGRWVLLGAMTKFVGTDGVLNFRGVRRVCEVLRCPRTELQSVIERLPNVSLTVSIEEGTSVNGEFTVTFKNWTKYQLDSTVAERVKALRYKRRRDKKRKEKNPSPRVPSPGGDRNRRKGSFEPTVGSETKPGGPEALRDILARVGFRPELPRGLPSAHE